MSASLFPSEGEVGRHAANLLIPEPLQFNDNLGYLLVNMCGGLPIDPGDDHLMFGATDGAMGRHAVFSLPSCTQVILRIFRTIVKDWKRFDKDVGAVDGDGGLGHDAREAAAAERKAHAQEAATAAAAKKAAKPAAVRTTRSSAKPAGGADNPAGDATTSADTSAASASDAAASASASASAPASSSDASSTPYKRGDTSKYIGRLGMPLVAGAVRVCEFGLRGGKARGCPPVLGGGAGAVPQPPPRLNTSGARAALLKAMVAAAAPFCLGQTDTGDRLRGIKAVVAALDARYLAVWSPWVLSGRGAARAVGSTHSSLPLGEAVLIMRPEGRGGDSAGYHVPSLPFALARHFGKGLVTALSTATREGLLPCLPLLECTLLQCLSSVELMAARQEVMQKMLQMLDAAQTPQGEQRRQKAAKQSAAALAHAAAGKGGMEEEEEGAGGGGASAAAPAPAAAMAAAAAVAAAAAAADEEGDADDEDEGSDAGEGAPVRGRPASDIVPNPLAPPGAPESRQADMAALTPKAAGALGHVFTWPCPQPRDKISVRGKWYDFSSERFEASARIKYVSA